MQTVRRRLPVRHALLILVFVALVCASARAGSAPAARAQVAGADAVFPLPGSALRDLGRQCPPFSPQVNVGSAGCVAQAMQQGGASAEAVSFYLSTGHILTGFQVGGQPVSPGTATYNIWCCTADTSDMEPVLLGGTPAVIYPLEETLNIPLSSYAGFDAAAAQFPMLSNGGLDRIRLDQITNSPEQGQRFIFAIELINVCRACGTGYEARAALDFGTDGTYYGVVPLDITCEAPPSDGSAGSTGSCGRAS